MDAADLSGFSEDDLDAALFVLRFALASPTLDQELKASSYAAYGRITLELEGRI